MNIPFIFSKPLIPYLHGYDFSIKCSYPPHWIGCDDSLSCAARPNDVKVMSCTGDYCKSAISISANNVNDQCVPGRMGIGCGQCVQKFSAVLGTSNCKPCSNSHLWLVVVYLGSGVLLIVLLIKFDITVTYGALNGIIFYANFVYINKDIFFPTKFSNQDVFRIALSWINLDLGFEVCFYKGMTTYQKTWLQFGYIFYIWSLQLVIVYLCRKYIFFTHICGRNVTKVMATLLLLSYMKGLRVIQTVLSFHHLHMRFTTSTHFVWSQNPAITFRTGKHIPLTIAASALTVVLVSFTICLISIQVLKKASSKRGLTWVSRLQPFFEAFSGPCNHNYAFWPGFLFLMRIALVLIHSLKVQSSYDKAITYCAIAILVSVFSFIFPSGVYKKWSLNVLELSIMLNLSLLSGLVNIKSISYQPLRIQHLTYTSMVLVLFSFLCYKIKPVYKAVRKLSLAFYKDLRKIFFNIATNNALKERRLSSSTANRVTRSEVQVSIPPNETSQLLNVSS